MSRSQPHISSISYPRVSAPVFSTRAAGVVACATVLVLHTALVLLALRSRGDVQNVDYWYHLHVGTQLDWSQPATLAHGFYPLGYPWLLRTAIDHGIDGVRFGQLLAWLGSMLALGSVFSIARRMTGSLLLALLALALLIANRSFFEYAVLEGNDMLAAGLQLLAIALVWRVSPERGWGSARRLSIVAGAVLGLGYLMRYTALIVLPCLALALLLTWRHQLRRALLLALLLIAAFGLSAAVQLVPSLIAFGTPFYNTQAKNVWFGVYGNQDWINNWSRVPHSITLGEVILLDPARFVRHWWAEYWRAFWSLRLWPLPLHVAWLLGGLSIAATRRLDLGQRALLLLTLLTTLAATALAWLMPRFLLVPLLLEALLIVALVERLARWLPTRRPYQLAAGGAALALLLGLTQIRPLIGWLTTPGLSYAQRVTALLRLAGLREARQVGTNDWLLHAADTVEHTQFVQLHQLLGYPSGVDELLALPQTAALRYLVLNYGPNGAGDYSAIQPDALADKRRLVPLSLEPTATAFCVLPCQPADTTPDQVEFANGMRLTGHHLRSADGAIGLYLYWSAARPLAESYIISLRVLNEQGRIVARQDSAPQLGTYPTPSWDSAMSVVDFHLLPQAMPEPGRYRLALVLYEQQSGEPVAATRPDAPAETTVIVRELSR